MDTFAIVVIVVLTVVVVALLIIRWRGRTGKHAHAKGLTGQLYSLLWGRDGP